MLVVAIPSFYSGEKPGMVGVWRLAHMPADLPHFEG